MADAAAVRCALLVMFVEATLLVKKVGGGTNRGTLIVSSGIGAGAGASAAVSKRGIIERGP